MHRALRSFVLVVALLSTLAPRAHSQYLQIFTDNPADSTRLRPGGTTILTIHLNTNHDRSDSLQTCNSHSAASCGATASADSLAMFSYQVILSAVGGTVSWGTFTPGDAAYTAAQAQIQGSHDVEFGFSRPVGTLSHAGPNTLGTISVTIVSGSPGIQVARSSGLDPFTFGTGFGTTCRGSAYQNSYVLGDPADPCGAVSGLSGDWFDTDGALPPTNSPPALAAPDTASGTEGSPLDTLTATATDPDGYNVLTLSQSGMPADLEFSTTPGPSPCLATISGTPAPGDAGDYTIIWTVTDGAGGTAIDTTSLAISSSGFAPSVVAPSSASGSASSPIEFTVSAQASAGRVITALQANGLPSGAAFVVDSTGSSGLFHWTPEPTAEGNFAVTFAASDSGATSETVTSLTVSAPDGPLRPRVSETLVRLRMGQDPDERLLSRTDDGRAYVNIFLTGDLSNEALHARGVEVGTRIGRMMTAQCLVDSLPALFDAPEVEAAVESGFCKLLLDSSTVDINVNGLRSVPPEIFSGRTGAGVVIGIIDTGIDFNSKDFKHLDGTTRIISYWDQANPVLVGPPSGFFYGKEWLASDINAGTNSALPESQDFDGHGTHVAGIAAGNAQAGEGGTCGVQGIYAGVAPEADLYIVKLQELASGNLKESVSTLESKVVDAVSYIFQRSSGLHRAAVVNLSLGSHEGPHDGLSYFDAMINGMTLKAASGKAKIVVAAAGNDNGQPVHASAQVHHGGAVTAVSLYIPPYTPSGTDDEQLVLHGFHVYGDTISVTITSPLPPDGHGIVVGPVRTDGTAAHVSTVDGEIDLCVSSAFACSPGNPWNGHDADIVVVLKNTINQPPTDTPPASGTWEFDFSGSTITSTGIIDMYLEEQRGGTVTDPAHFVNAPIQWTSGVDYTGDVTSPASADSVIAVGAYTTKTKWRNISGADSTAVGAYGNICPFSSLGPRRDGVIKPDITAPGQMIASTLSQSAKGPQGIPDGYWLQAGFKAVLAGTSMSAPHVAGAVALMLSDPGDTTWQTAYPSRVKDRLKNTARRDGFTGPDSNSVWGWGKLDVAAALNPVYSLRFQTPRKGTVWHPRDTDSIAVVSTLYTSDSIVVDLSRQGCPQDPSPIRLVKFVNAPPGVRQLSLFAVPDSFRTTVAGQPTKMGVIHAIAYARSGSTNIVVQAVSDLLIDSVAVVTGVPVDQAPGLRFALGQNTPNPFNPMTTMRLEIAKAGLATLRVYSVDGRLVRTLIQRPLAAGLYRVKWDGNDDQGEPVGSGVYFSQAVSDGKRIGRKMVVLR